MKKIIIIFLIIFIVVILKALNVDSLQTQLEITVGKERFEILSLLSKHFINNDEPDRSILYAEEALKIAEDLKDFDKIADCNNYIGRSNYENAKFKEAIPSFEIVLEITKKLKNKKKMAESLYMIGNCYRKTAEFNSAIEKFQQSKIICEEIDERRFIAHNLLRIGNIYEDIGEYDKAVESYHQALVISEEQKDIRKTADILNNIANVYLQLQNFDKAIEYHKKALKIRKEINNRRGISVSYNNLANVYKNLEQLDLALKYYLLALDNNKERNDLFSQSKNLNNIGNIYKRQGDYEKALDSYSKSYQIKRKLNDEKGLALLYPNIAELHFLKNDYQKALDYYNKSQEIAVKFGLKRQVNYHYQRFSDVYSALGDFQQAYEYHKLYFATNDSIFNEEKFKTITEIQTKYETEKKEKEIEILTKNTEIQDLKLKENRIVKYTFILGFIIAFLLASLIYRAYRRERIEIEKRKIVEEELHDLNKNLEKRVETEVQIRREQEQKAVEQSRLATLGELAAGIAHEINQPLHSIAFAIDNMSMAIEEDDADKEYLQKKTKNIFSDVDRMKRIIDHIRTFSRKQAGEEKEPFNINQSITNAVNMISEQYANHRIKLDIELDKNLPETMGNIYRFEQVVLILLSNGKDAIEERAKVVDNNYQKKLSIRTFQKDKKNHMEFEDNGTGISKENLDKIFNPFYTTKKQGEGTGLGLSIAFGIVGEMNGKIEVESEVGVGTKMKIELMMT